MATIIATAGAADANSYALEAEADAYLATQSHETAWSGADSTAKTNALVEATDMLDNYVDWVGKIVGDTQALRWPRNYVSDPDGRAIANDAVPTFLMRATALLALFLIKANRTSDRSDLGIDSVAVPGAVNVKFSKSDKKKVLPDAVYVFVKEYGNVRGHMSHVPVIRS